MRFLILFSVRLGDWLAFVQHFEVFVGFEVSVQLLGVQTVLRNKSIQVLSSLLPGWGWDTSITHCPPEIV
jgi:hypothetical protein